MPLSSYIKPPNRQIALLLGFCIILGVGFLDYITGHEISFSLFYVVPIVFVTWFNGRIGGVIAALGSAAMWYLADDASGHEYSHILIPFWNCTIRLSFFLIITWLLSELSAVMHREQKLARIDNLTGAVNSRYFFELAQMEIDRLTRYRQPFTVVYIDLDNFKKVNDEFGHATGDNVLCRVVEHTRENLRKNDIIARLGGDEFALLLPETNQESARAALTKLQAGLLNVMQNNNWPISFSIGALTCHAAPPNTDKLIKLADDLMYFVKRNNKNAIKYATFTG